MSSIYTGREIIMINDQEPCFWTDVIFTVEGELPLKLYGLVDVDDVLSVVGVSTNSYIRVLKDHLYEIIENRGDLIKLDTKIGYLMVRPRF
jgi:hypothetical protein